MYLIVGEETMENSSVLEQQYPSDKQTESNSLASSVSQFEESSTDLAPPVPEKASWVQGLSLQHTKEVTLPPLPPRANPPKSHTTNSTPPLHLQPLPQAQPLQSSTTSAKTQWLSKDQTVARVTTLKGLLDTPDDLPVVFRFVDGYYGQTTRFSINNGDCYQANFVKHTRVLNIEDHVRRYKVPLTSTAKFGLIMNNLKVHVSPMTIPNILAIKELPHVVCAINDIVDKKGNVIVNEKDLLIIRKRKQKVLRCHNLTSRSDVILKKSFVGTFTLDPDATKMYPLDIINHLPENIFPCRAKRYFDQSRADIGQNDIVTIKSHNIDVCLVATEIPACTEEVNNNTVHLPVDGELGKLCVEVLSTDNEEQLYEDAYKLLQTFDPTVGITYADMDTDAAFDIQTTFLREIRTDQLSTGIELQTSIKVSSKQKQNISESKHDDSDKHALVVLCPNDPFITRTLPSKDKKTNPSTVTPLASAANVIQDTTLPPITESSDTDSDDYTFIPDYIALPKALHKEASRPVAKPRKHSTHKSSCTTTSFTHKQLSGSAAEVDSDQHYDTIPDVIQKKSFQIPVTKPQHHSGLRSQMISQATTTPHLTTGTQHKPPLPTVPAYLHHHPHQTIESRYTTSPQLKTLCQPPRPKPRTKSLTSEQLQKIRKENITFLKEMNDTEVIYCVIEILICIKILCMILYNRFYSCWMVYI